MARRRELRWLLATAGALALIDGCARLTYTGRQFVGRAPLAWFDATDEWTVPTLFAVAVTAAVGIVCLRRRDGTHAWQGFGALFVWLALDDLLSLHEQIGTWLHPWLRGTPIYSWVVVLGPVFAVVATWTAYRIQRELPRRHRLWLGAGLALFAAALAFEAGESAAARSALRLRGIPWIDYSQWLEESCELLAPVLVLAAVRRPAAAPQRSAVLPTAAETTAAPR